MLGWRRLFHQLSKRKCHRTISSEEEEVTVGTLLSALKASGAKADLEAGQNLHSLAVSGGFHRNVYVANALISMYSKCRDMASAEKVFNLLSDVRNVVLWNTIILGYVDNGDSLQALRLFESMDCEPTSYTTLAGLKALSRLATGKQLSVECCVEKGVAIHERARSLGHDTVVFVTNALVDMYCKCSAMDRARDVFETATKKDVVLWTTLIQGYADNREGLKAYQLFTSMDCEPDQFTFVAVLKGLSSEKLLMDKDWCLARGQEVHRRAKACHRLDWDTFVATGLVTLYSRCCDMTSAREAFDSMARRNVVAWNTLLLGYVNNGESRRALEVYRRMDCDPDAFTLVAALKACVSLADEDRELSLETGFSLHQRAEELGVQTNLFVSSNLVDMYSKSGDMTRAQKVFDVMKERDVIAWTSLMLGYVDNGESYKALELFERMDCKPSSVTFVVVLKACSQTAAAGGSRAAKESCLKKGSDIHKQVKVRGLESDPFVATNLVNMYGKCGSIERAHEVFNLTLNKNVVLWNALMLGYVETGENSQIVLDLFKRMDCEPTSVTYVAVLRACADVGALSLGREIHSEVCRLGLDGNKLVANSLVYLYGKCSRMVNAEELFHQTLTRQDDVSCWNVLMAGYSSLGLTSEVFRLFGAMEESRVEADGITYLLVLLACSHSGRVEEGRECLESMIRGGVVKPLVEHYTCVIDSLARANRIQEALQLMKTMPCEPDSAAWAALLGSCKNLADVHVGRVAFDALVAKDVQHGLPYVLMSQIFMKLGSPR